MTNNKIGSLDDMFAISYGRILVCEYLHTIRMKVWRTISQTTYEQDTGVIWEITSQFSG